MICACVSSFGFFVSFVFVFWKWPTDGRAFRIADTTPAQLRDLQQTKHFRTGCPFIFTFFFWFLPPKSCVFLGSWFLGTDERKQNVSMVFLLFFWSSGQLGSLVGSLLRTVGAAAALRQLRHGDQSENDAADAADTVEYPRHRPPRWTFFFFLCHRTFYLERVVLPRNSNPSFSETFFFVIGLFGFRFFQYTRRIGAPRHGQGLEFGHGVVL